MTATLVASPSCRSTAGRLTAYRESRPAPPGVPSDCEGMEKGRPATPDRRKGMSQTMIRTDICRLFVASLCLLAGVVLRSTSVEAQAQRGAQKLTERISASPKEVKFEVISIKPIKGDAPGFTSYGPTPTGYRSQTSIWKMIKLAYVPGFSAEWENTPLLNTPKWLYEEGSNNYAVEARVSKEDMEAWQHQGLQRELLRSALRALLRERCKLVVHTEPREVEEHCDLARQEIGRHRPLKAS